jgi:hypothetical protein
MHSLELPISRIAIFGIPDLNAPQFAATETAGEIKHCKSGDCLITLTLAQAQDVLLAQVNQPPNCGAIQ